MLDDFRQHAPSPYFSSANGELLIAGRPVSAIVAAAGRTPVYCYDSAVMSRKVAEFRVEAYDSGALTEISIELEPTAEFAAGNISPEQLSERVSRMVQDTLAFRAAVRAVPCGSLPRFEIRSMRTGMEACM